MVRRRGHSLWQWGGRPDAGIKWVPSEVIRKQQGLKKRVVGVALGCGENREPVGQMWGGER